MASEAADPAAPQSEVITVSTTNNKARLNAYTDPALTKRNVTGTLAASDITPKSGSTVRQVRSVYAEDLVEEIDQEATNPGVDPPPHSANKWEIETTADGIERAKDPYRNNGMISQNDFLSNA